MTRPTASSAVLLALFTSCGDGESTGGGRGEHKVPMATDLLLDAVESGQAKVDSPWDGTSAWQPVELAREQLGYAVSLPESGRAHALPIELEVDAAGAPLKIEWQSAAGDWDARGDVLSARRVFPLHQRPEFADFPQPADTSGQRRVVVPENTEIRFPLPRHGLETHAVLTVGFGPGASYSLDAVPEIPPSATLCLGDRVLGRIAVDYSMQRPPTLRVPLPPEAGEFSIRVEGVEPDVPARWIALKTLALEVEDGRDRIRVPEDLPDDWQGLHALVRTPRPLTPLVTIRSSDAQREIRRELAVIAGPSTLRLRPRAAAQVLLDGAVVARSEVPLAQLPFEIPRSGVSTLEVRFPQGPWRGDAVLLQPGAAFLSMPRVVRGQEDDPPAHPLVRHVTFGSATRRSLLLVSGSAVTVPLQWKSGDSLELLTAAIDLSGGATRRETLTLKAELRRGDGPSAVLLEAVAPLEEWQRGASPLPGSGRGELVLRAESQGDASLSRMLLLAAAEPRIIRAAPPPLPNVVIYLVDTLRADRLSAYGNPRKTSPALDALAADAILFEGATAQAPWTKPSVASIFSGLLASFHGAGKDTSLPPTAETLAEVLRDAGYHTAAFVANPYVYAKGLNFEQGFSEFHAVQPPGRSAIASDVTETALPWLEQNRDRPFFLYLHTLDPHEPYDPPPSTAGRFRGDYQGPLRPDRTFARDLRRKSGLSPEDRQFLLDLYDEEVLFNDGEFGRVLERLIQLDLYENALVVFLSDHGELLSEHQDFGHGTDLWEELLHVPLVVKLPGPDRPRGVRIPGRVPTTCLLPTVTQILGLDLLPPVQGVDLAPWWSEEQSSLDVIAENLPEQRSLLRGPLKLIEQVHPRTGQTSIQVFDLAEDPAELRDLAATRPEVAAELRDYLDALLRRDRQRGLAVDDRARRVDLSPDQEALLRQLGYLDDSRGAGGSKNEKEQERCP